MGIVHTLTGSVDAKELGPVLPHEHLPMHYKPFGWPAGAREDFEPGSRSIVSEWCGPILDDLVSTPFRTLVDVTPIGLGRDIAFRREIVGQRPLNVVMSTGFYVDAHQPEWAKEKPAEELADLFVKEIEEGIADTGVRAGIIKLAPSASSGQSRKVCRAGVMTSKRTGARITTHSNECCRESFDMLVGLGAPPESLYIGHADFAEFEENAHICRNGGNVLFTVWDIDYMIPEKRMYKRFVELVRAGFLRNVLLSVDFAIMVQDPKRPTFLSWTLYGVEGRTHSYLHKTVLPRFMSEYGLTRDEIKVITEENPRRMLDFRG